MTTRTTRLRNPALAITLGAAACLAVTSVHASESVSKKASKQETVGVTTGFTVGAAAGGPVGAILGAAAGAWLGDRYHRQVAARSALAADLDESESERAKLSGTLANVQAVSEQMEHALDRTRDLETSVGFRTDDATVSADGAARVQRIGALARALPGAKIRVSGFADPRGSEEYNAQLSRRRAEAVAALLKEAGVDEGRLIIETYGESQSSTADGDLDGYAFDRRVTVRLEGGGVQALARAQ